MKDFVRFLFSKTDWRAKADTGMEHLQQPMEIALRKCVADVRYHIPDISDEQVVRRITTNQNELPMFLFRFGNELYARGGCEEELDAIHWIMRECCSCEIYYSNLIDVGLYILHGIGTVVGSRNRIGRGFIISQNCTIGHKADFGNGSAIGSDVTMFPHSSIIGEVTIGDNVVVGAHSLVLHNMPSNVVCCGNPATVRRTISTGELTFPRKGRSQSQT